MEQMDKIKKLREERAKLINDQRAILNLAQEEKRDLSADENTNYENMEKRFDEITDEINGLTKEVEKIEADELRRKKLEDKEKMLQSSQYQPLTPDPNANDDDQGKRNIPEFAEYRVSEKYNELIENYRKSKGYRKLASVEYLNSFKRYLIEGDHLTAEHRNVLFSTDVDFRALQADDDKSGGYLVAPEQLVVSIIQELDNRVFVRQYANVIPLPNAASLGAPARDNDVGDTTWTSEIKTGGMDTDLDFDKRSLTPHPLARGIKASRKLIRIAMIDIGAYIAQRFGYKLGTVEENAFLNGSGVNQPLGVFTSSDHGISSARDVSTGNTTTGITADGLINCQMGLKSQYRNLASCRWCFHRDGIKMIRKLKDGEGQYLWKMGIADGKPDTILGKPYEESEYAPSTFTTGKIVGIIGDWAQYWIADSLAMEIQVVDQLYAATNQMGYFCRKETDGMPVLEEAFSRVVLA